MPVILKSKYALVLALLSICSGIVFAKTSTSPPGHRPRSVRPSDPAVGANVTFTSCTPGMLLASSPAGMASYTFGPTDCDGNGFTAVCNSSGASAAAPARVLISAISSVPILRFDRGGAGTAAVTSVQFYSTSGARFKLTHLNVYPVNGGNQTITVTAYAGGVAVSGSAVTINYGSTIPIHSTTLTAADFGTAYNNIDQIKITTSVIYGVSINDIQTASPITSLPVSLVSFTGRQQGGSVVLNWSTASESDNSYFEIQRMAAGGAWTGIGKVEGHGTVTTEEDYIFTDPQPLSGTDYYRLQQVDLDGNSVYSSVLAIEQQGEGNVRSMTLFPNPVQGNLNLTFNSDKEETGTIIIRDLSGVSLLKNEQAINKGFNSIALTGLQNLAQALYIITLITPTATYQAKFLKGK